VWIIFFVFKLQNIFTDAIAIWSQDYARDYLSEKWINFVPRAEAIPKKLEFVTKFDEIEKSICKAILMKLPKFVDGVIDSIPEQKKGSVGNLLSV
jgi:hypothetical protein